MWVAIVLVTWRSFFGEGVGYHQVGCLGTKSRQLWLRPCIPFGDSLLPQTTHVRILMGIPENHAMWIRYYEIVLWTLAYKQNYESKEASEDKKANQAKEA